MIGVSPIPIAASIASATASVAAVVAAIVAAAVAEHSVDSVNFETLISLRVTLVQTKIFYSARHENGREKDCMNNNSIGE